MAIDQRITIGEWLGHTNHRIIDGCITVRVVLTHDFTDDVGRLDVRFIRQEARIIHCP